MCAVRKGNASGESSTVKGVWDMPELRTREVEDLLEVFAGLTRPDDVFALLEDLFTVREIKDTSQRLDVARMLRKGCYRKGNRRLCDNHRPRIEGVELRCRRIWFGI